MAFSVNLVSVDGYFVGRCKPITTMENATIEGAPQESTSEIAQFSFARSGYDVGIMEWNNYYLPACVQYGAMNSMVDFWDYLTTNNYDLNNPLVVCAFKVVDGQGTETGIQLCLMAYSSSSTGNVTWQMKKRIMSQGIWNYTNISPTRTDNIYNMTGFGMMCGLLTINGKQWYSFGFANLYADYQTRAVLFGNTTDGLSQVVGGTPSGDPVSPEFGDASQPGGGYNDIPGTPHGTFDDSSDIISIDAKPSVGVTTMGFVNVYKITQGQLQQLGEKLFPHFLPAEILADPAQLTTPEVLTMMIKTLYGALISPAGTTVQLADNLGIIDILMNGKLIDYVIDCHAIPTSISDATVEGLKVGYRQFNDLQVARATEDYVDVDCGSLNIGEYFANFLDFVNVSCDLWLPFVGFVPIDSEYWNGGTLHVVYRFNIVDGSFQAKVLATSSKSKLTESIIGQYGGVACVHYPITGLQYSNVVAGLVNGSISAVASGASGDYAKTATNLANMAMLRPDNPMSNGYNASSSFLSHRTPYLVIKRPTPQFSMQYPKEIGLPLNVTLKLSSVSGFTVIDNPILNIDCSDDEYNEIVSLLKSGVIF